MPHKYTTGTVQPILNRAKITSISKSLPPKDEKRRLVGDFYELTVLYDMGDEQLAPAQTEGSRLEALSRNLRGAQ